MIKVTDTHPEGKHTLCGKEPRDARQMLRSTSRKAFLFALAIVFLLLPVAQASASGVSVLKWNGDPFPRYQRWADRAKTVEPPGRVYLRIGSCSDPRYNNSCTIIENNGRVNVYIVPDQKNVRWLFYHELGHVFLIRMGFTDSEQRRAASLLGVSQSQGVSLRFRERYAEAYRFCALGVREKVSTGYYGFKMSARQLSRFCGLLRLQYARWEATTPHPVNPRP